MTRALRFVALCSLSASVLFPGVLLQGCAPQRPAVPVGEIPEAAPPTVTEEQYGHEVLGKLSERWKLDYNHPRYQNVLDVVERLTKAARADQNPWHVYVFKDDTFKNAGATRGNHVFIWTGMIDATQNDEELAAVLGHEIGHVLARHTDPDPNEELKRLALSVGAMAAGIAAAAATGNGQLAQTAGELASQLTNEIGSGIFVYPYSRDREREADQIGLFLMAEAGFNPEGAVRFWTRAGADPSFGGAPLEFLSTHPPAADRLERLRQYLPRAMARYRGEEPPRARSSDAATSAPPTGSPPLGSAAGSSAPSGDSWDVGSLDPKARRVPPLDPPLELWQVAAERAILRSKADATSTALGEFKRGAIVRSREEAGGWIRITRPERGYLRAKDLRRLP